MEIIQVGDTIGPAFSVEDFREGYEAQRAKFLLLWAHTPDGSEAEELVELMILEFDRPDFRDFFNRMRAQLASAN